jgi:hypothetical protein
MIWHRHRDGPIPRNFLDDDVAAALPNFREPVAREYPAELSA